MPREYLVPYVLAALASSIAGAAAAGDWQVVPSVTLSESHTDNVDLTNGDEQGDLITTVSPSINIRGEGRRLLFNVDYLYQFNKFLDRSELDNGTHNLQANVQNELVREHLFLDVNASMFPALVNNQGQVSNRNLNRRDRLDLRDQGNRSDIVAYGFTPRYVHALGSFADFTASSNYSDTSTSGGAAGGGRNNTLNVGLNSGRRFQRVGWGLNFERRDNTLDTSTGTGGGTDTEQTFQNVFANTGIQLNRMFRLTGRVGIEDNQFQTSQGQQGGPSWFVGGVLTPNVRTSLAGQFGQRPFGNTKQFNFNYRRRRFTLAGNYNEELATSNEILRDQQVFRREDPFGNPIPLNPIDNADFGLPLNEVGLTNDVFVSRRLDAVIGYERRRDSVFFNVFRNGQESTRTQLVDDAVGFGAAWTRRLSPRTSLGLRGDYQVRTSEGQQGDQTFIYVSPFLSYAIGPQLSSRLAYSWTDSDADDPLNTFTENTITGSLSYAF